MTPPPATRAPPLRGIREGEEPSLTLPPQAPGRELGAFAAALELGPHDLFGDQLGAGEGAEAAVAGGDDAAAVADGVDGLADAVGNDFGMLHEIRLGIDDAGQQQELLRQL